MIAPDVVHMFARLWPSFQDGRKMESFSDEFKIREKIAFAL